MPSMQRFARLVSVLEADQQLDTTDATVRSGRVVRSDHRVDADLIENAELPPRTFCAFAREFSPFRAGAFLGSL